MTAGSESHNTVRGDSEARRRAVEDTGHSFIMEAAAGTGKTHTLISRILHLVLEKGPKGPPLRLTEVCAITFTEKAANEMKSRLRFELEKKLEETAGPDTSDRIIQALDDIETAAISTFHSFAAGLLKERPIEAGIDPQFSVLDDIQRELFFRKIWYAWISAALRRRDPALEKALRGGFDLQSLKNLTENLSSNPQTIRELRCAAPDKERIYSEISDRLRLGRGLLRRLINPDDKLAVFFTDALKWLENPDSYTGVLKNPGGAGAQANWEGGKDTVINARNFLKKAVELQTSFIQIPARRLMYETVQWLCADFILSEWENKKSASGYLDFDDQLHIASELLRRHSGVRAEFQERYKTLLVDEFQDTDPVQLEIVLLLTLKHGDSEPEPGRLFIVGDPKQSIYRFRGADIETYLGLAHDEKLREPYVERLTINRNFRSVPSILRFADEAFAETIHPPNDGNYQSFYTAFNNEGARRDEPSAPSVHILGDGADENIERKTEDVAALEAERIAKLIRSMHDSDLYNVHDPAAPGARRPARYGDIAILLPALSHSDKIEDALREASVPYILEGGRLYYTRSEVGSAVTALSALSDPGNEAALCGALKSVFFGISDEDLLRARMEGITLDYRIPAPVNSPFYAPFEILRELRRRRHERPASETFEILLQETGAREILAARGPQHLANMNKISRALRTIEGTNGFSLTIELLSILEKDGLNESESRLAEARSDAVRVMTIHKSKGLDFPIVIVAALGLSSRTSAKMLLADRHNRKIFAVKSGDMESGFRTECWDELNEGNQRREDAELVRLLYVALTRAGDHLILSTHTCKRKKTNEGVFVPDVSGTRLKPLDAVLHKCNTDETPARRIDTTRLDAYVIPEEKPESSADKAAGDRVKSVVQEYRELRELIENASGTDLSKAAAERGKSNAEDGINPAAKARRRSARLGTAFHEVMERVELKDLTGLAELSDDAGTRNHLNSAACRQLRDMVEKCLNSDLMRRARAAAREGRRVLRETPFIRPLKEGGFEELRIDLLFEEGDAWTIADYKTGRLPSNIKEAAEAEQYFRNRYMTQAQAYRKALESLSMKPGGVFLLTIRTGDVIDMGI